IYHMKLFRTRQGNVLEAAGKYYHMDQPWDELVNRDGLYTYLEKTAASGKEMSGAHDEDWLEKGILPPIGSQEVWAAGVTYLRSRNARMEESKAAGGGDFYDRVYSADRPELFFKALPQRVVGDHDEVNIRRDSTWNVPEPELTLYINSFGEIQ